MTPHVLSLLASITTVLALAVPPHLVVTATTPEGHPPVIGYLTNTTPPDRFQQPQRYGDGDIELVSAFPGYISVRMPAAQGSYPITFFRSDNGPLQLGVNQRSESPASRFEVLDLAVDEMGRVSRFDIVFPVGAADPVDAFFGGVRMGQDETDVRFAGRNLKWPQVPVGGKRVWVEEAVRNTGERARTLGRATITGAHPADFAIANDSCSGRTLQPSATCTLRAGYSPKQSGPRSASLRIPVEDEVISASMSGTAPVGRSRTTVSGNNFIALDKTRTDEDGSEVIEVPRSSRTEADFTAQRTYSTWSAATDVGLYAPPGAELREGTFAVSDDVDDAYRLHLSRAERGCNGTTGTVKVSDLAFAADGTVARAHLTFSVRCGNDRRPGLVKGEVLWRHRADVTPPRGPGSLKLSGLDQRTVSWTRSRSADAVDTMVRLVPGDGTGATPTSGYAIAVSPSGTAALGPLPEGKQFTLMAWAVDSTGNVSGALRRTLTG